MTRRETRKVRPSAAAPTPRRSLPLWAQRILAPLAFGGVAAACVPLGVADVVACARALADGAPVVDFYPREAMTIPLCVAFALLAAMCTLPDPEIRLRPSRRSPAARRTNRIASPMFAGVALGMFAVPAAPFVASLAMTWDAARHGYVGCPSPASNRYGLVRWARGPAACGRNP